MIIRIACADTNTEYLERLVEVLEETKELHVSMYSDAAILREHARAGRFDVLLLDPSMYSADLPVDRIPVTVMLAGDEPIPYACGTLPAIRKYQRISAIRTRLFEICSENKKLAGAGTGFSGAAQVFAVYSPAGGAGKTTAALIAAQRLAAHGKRTLYLNLENFPSDGVYLTADTGVGGLSDVMARLDDKGAEMFLKSCIQTKCDNFFFLRHFDSPNDRSAMSAEECTQLLAMLRGCGAFDCILVDTDSAFDACVRAVFTAADKILLVERAEGSGAEKTAAFLAQTHIMDDYGLKMRRLINFAGPNTQSSGGGVPVIGRMTAVNTADTAALIAHKAGGADAAFALKLEE